VSLLNASILAGRDSLVSFLIECNETVEHPVNAVIVEVRQNSGGFCTNRQAEHSSVGSAGTTSNFTNFWLRFSKLYFYGGL